MLELDSYRGEKTMKKSLFTALAALFFICVSAVTTLTDGSWDNPEIWDSGTIPTATDDEIVNRLVTIGALAECHNLTLQGSDSMVRNNQQLNGTLNIFGDLVSTGWIASNNSGSRYLTCNLYGNLVSYYNFTPGTLNILGSGNRTWNTGQDSYLSPWFSINVAATIDTVFASGDINIACSQTSVNGVFAGTDSVFVLVMQDPVSRTAHNLNIRNTTVQKAWIIGSGSNILTWDNNRSGYIQDVRIENISLNTVSTMLIANEVVLKDVTNNGTIYNLSSAHRILTLEGLFTNNGNLRCNPSGYNLNLNCYGNIYNNGYFAPADLQILGSGDRSLACTIGNPFRVQNNLSIATTIGTIQALTDLSFVDTDYIYNGNFSLVSGNRDGWDLITSNVTFSGSVLVGETGSELNVTNTSFDNSILQNLLFPANSTLSFMGSSSLSNCQNYGIIQNNSAYYQSLSVTGDFTNYGTIRNNPSGYDLTINADANLGNRGVWTCKAINLVGSAAQTISFPSGYPLQTAFFSCIGSATAVHIAPGEDFYANNCEMDFNSKTLLMPEGVYGLFFNTCLFKEAVVNSSLSNHLNLVNTNIQQCSFVSITNNQVFTIISNTIINGNFVNNGTVQNSHAYNYSLSIYGTFINNGTVRNNPSGYSLSCFVSGDMENNGSLTCHSLTLNGNAPQSVYFPSEHPFQAANFIKADALFPLTASADLYFTNCTVNMNNSQLLLNSGGNRNLFLNNCVYQNCAIVSNQASNLNMLNGGYLHNVSLQSIHFSGTVSLSTDTTVSGTLINDGTLRNHNNYIQNLYVHDLINNGTLQNNSSGYSLKPHIMQSLVNSGTISTTEIFFDGMDCSLTNTGTISSTTISVPIASATLSLMNNFSLTNLALSFHSSRGTLNLVSGTWGITLSMTGGSISNANILGGSGARLNGSNYFVLRNSQANELETEGSVLVESVSIGYLKNHGTIKNSTTTYQTMQIGTRLDNYATIASNNAYSLSLAIGGDLYNYGSINLQAINFSGSGNQKVFIASLDNYLQTVNLTKSAGTGTLIMASDLAVRSAAINLNSQNLQMFDGRSSYNLSIDGGNISNTYLATSGFSGLQMSGSAYLNSLSGGDIIFSGTPLLNGNNYFGNVVNTGVLKNQTYVYSFLTVTGNFTNQGTVADNVSYNLTLNVAGDFNNTGTISNYAVNLNGNSAQNVLRGGTLNPLSFYLVSNIGSSQWFLDGVFTGTTSASIAIPIASNSILGNWQPL